MPCPIEGTFANSVHPDQTPQNAILFALKTDVLVHK